MNQIIALLNPQFTSALSGPALYLTLVTLGGIIGVLVGLFGVGGGFLIVPLINVIVGVPYEIAVGSSVVMIIGTGTAGLLAHRTAGTVHLRIALTIAAGSILGTVAGDLIQTALMHTAGFTTAMHILFMTLLGVAVFLTIRDPLAVRKTRPVPPAQQEITSLPVLLTVGLVTGILTGLLGIGGGVILVPVLIGLVGLGPRKAAGTSLAIVLVAAVAATFQKTLFGQAKVSLPVALALLISGVIGVQIGIHLARSVSGRNFRRAYLAVLFLAAVIIASDLFF